MPRRKRHEKVSGYHIDRIERQARLMRIVLDEARLSLIPFKPHHDAIAEYNGATRRLLNILNDRPADWEEPHRGPMSGS
ncbi:hypothetical protein L598_003900000060 [Mesorhizobium sp. J18]|uniref:hypothetical protein n=1 Tax=Mesorhizobium sp. J18 TaxID=935263 RepID=UPI00119A536E|nr:hypothetical protein [Mesorhizobium sp. J18]TWG94097.1 hypothetical protein L598_003900000060 [Mesorhizobium sp. J18]